MDAERYISVEMSLIGSLLEIREMQAGRLPKPTLEDFFAEIDELIKQEEISEEAVTLDNQEKYERYIPVEMSLVGSLIEIREMRAGRLPEKSWREVRAEIEAELAEEEREELNERRGHKAF